MVNTNVGWAKRSAAHLSRANKAMGFAMAQPILQLLLLFCLAFNAFAADIGVTADRNPVNLNDSFQLVFSSDASPDSDPDFSPLEADFNILSQSKSEQASWINGTSSRTVQWTLTVMAKRAGELTVPPIAFGRERSNALRIVVTEQNQAPQVQAADQDLFLQAEATPHKPYVQAQVIYSLRLYRRVDIVQAELSEPEAKDAIVEKLGEDSNYRTEVNGQPYVVTERKYAIFPQHSGALTINPPVLTAQIAVGGRSRFDSFFGTPATRTKRVVGKAITLDVQAAPQEFKGAHWLPAEHLELQQDWSGAIDSAKIGEPLTRTLTLTANGATAGQLPDFDEAMQGLKSASGGELKNYPDQPVIKEQKSPGGISALRQQKIALIPSQAGEYRLPAIEIPWWNTRTDKLEIARIPEQIIKAAAAAEPSAQPALPPALQQSEQTPAQVHTAPAVAATAVMAGNKVWMGATLFSSLGWLLTALLWWRSSHQTPAKQQVLRKDGAAISIKALQAACRSNNATAAKDALIAWGRERFGESALGAIAKRCATELRAEIDALNRCLYAPGAQPWSGAGLGRAFSRFAKQAPAQDDVPEALESLYKH